MAMYAGNRSSITPSVGVANWILESVSGTEARIMEVSWGGESTTSTAMRTRIARDSATGTGSRTTTGADVQKLNNHSPANGVFFSSSYATLQPTIVAGNLFGTSWNSHGGVIRWLAAPGEEFVIYDATAANCNIECRADVGAGVSSYHVIWAET